MDKVRPWFHENIYRFQESRTSTPVGDGEHYVTVGRLVPIKVVLDEVAGIFQYEKREGDWKTLTD